MFCITLGLLLRIFCFVGNSNQQWNFTRAVLVRQATSNNQRLANAGEDFFLPLFLNKRFGSL